MDRDFLLKIADDFLMKNDLPQGWYWETGATRYVLINDEEDWVIKFDINDDDEFYSRTEYENYCEAINCNLQNYFAETQYLGQSAEGKEFFIQRRYNVSYDKVRDSFSDYMAGELGWEEENTYGGDYDLEPEDSLAAMFGYDRDLAAFIRRFRINDLHEGNYGFNNDYEPILIDYAGY